MNQKFSIEELRLKGAYVISPFVSSDSRGCFIKDYSYEMLLENGIDYKLMEVFYTVSKKGVIRGLHFQNIKQQPKLVRCISGKIYDVIVDLRSESSTYRQWLSFVLSGDNNTELLIPSGFAHGYLVLEDSIVSYKCAEKFYGEYDSGIKWNDEDLCVDWPVEKVGGMKNVILSEKDNSLQSFKEYEKNNKKDYI